MKSYIGGIVAGTIAWEGSRLDAGDCLLVNRSLHAGINTTFNVFDFETFPAE